ncbi:hypothetical protein HOY82DRAFT_619230 [Tuber indicum]|nr:hypothetical protein HOY82DRAFT_619230 [Tuber indicum]
MLRAIVASPKTIASLIAVLSVSSAYCAGVVNTKRNWRRDKKYHKEQRDTSIQKPEVMDEWISRQR